MHLPTRSVALTLAFAALALAACGRPNVAQTNKCTADTDCQAGEYCDAGSCQQNAGCTTNDECMGAMICDTQSGICVEAPVGECTRDADCSFSMHCKLATHKCVECLSSSHCAASESCLGDGTCGAEAAGCTSDADCGGLACDTATGNCVQCVANADCPAGQTCRNNACGGTGNTPPPCTQQSDCDMLGKVCVDNQCVACQTDTECGTGRRCAAGVCATNPGTTPPSGDGTCQTMDQCGGQACFVGYCVPCLSDFMCMDLSDPLAILTGGASKICDTATMTCIDPQCATAAECPAGQGCYSSHCGACQANSECRGGEVCTAGTCGPAAPPPPPGTAVFGATCVPGSATDAERCSAGLYCLDEGGLALCTRVCVGSGKGGDDDCPTGYACYNYDDGALDGAKLCVKAEQITTAPGYPFTQMPGASCATANECVTGACDSTDQTCAAGCVANRDCGAGQVCYAGYTDGVGDNLCDVSDTSRWLPVGSDCINGDECDSGICSGGCGFTGSLCNNNSECTFGCSGTCLDHCRNNADCLSGEVCNLWPMDTADSANLGAFVPVCMAKQFQGATADGGTCTADADCTSEWCIAGKCTTLCGTTADCSGIASTTCALFTFEDNGTPVFSAGFCQ